MPQFQAEPVNENRMTDGESTLCFVDDYFLVTVSVTALDELGL